MSWSIVTEDSEDECSYVDEDDVGWGEGLDDDGVVQEKRG